ncbi:hypothetical protein WJX73_009876 [Symbiochloris irregularis]|uniref:Chlorophyll a-b binding protein, chloroplastic n=1 Tax=Symbiochloris irregularis TaxID=706552 RepID=A0AAW1P2L8_9CHLO
MKLLSQGLSSGLAGTRAAPPARSTRLIVQARRTVAEKFKNKSEPNWKLDDPKRLYEIGGYRWLPLSTFEPPEYLDGSLPGDRGFDPFRLGALWGNPPNEGDDATSRVGWLLEGELYNGRLAMLAAVGILTVELLGRGPFWKAVDTTQWSGPGYVVGIVLFHLVFALLEKNRIESFEETGEAGHFGFAPFDPLGQVSDYNRQAEVRNARTAMLAVLGFATQAWVTGKGPLENAYDHYTDPFGANVFTYGEKGYYVAGFVVAFAAVMHLVEGETVIVARDSIRWLSGSQQADKVSS